MKFRQMRIPFDTEFEAFWMEGNYICKKSKNYEKTVFYVVCCRTMAGIL